MAFRLSAELDAKLALYREAELTAKQTFAALDDASLADSAEFWMQHCDAPKRIEPDRPVYDSTFWHAIVPEMIKRLKAT